MRLLTRLSLLIVSTFLVLSACTNEKVEQLPNTGNIYLYGEAHGVEKIYNKEFELWNDYYHEENFRHLFVEYPSYTAEYLNLWMLSDNDEILNSVYNDWMGTLSYNEHLKAFFKKVKSECPKTIFHGTDVGHQYNTTGARYLKELEARQLTDSKEYKQAQKVIEQGIQYYRTNDQVYRENMMIENFISEYNLIEGENIMGIYGAAHTGLNAMDFTGAIKCMAAQLKDVYPNIQSFNLSEWAKNTIPERIETIKINELEYEAAYFGEEDLTGFMDFTKRRFWRLENAYDEFKKYQLNGDLLPFNNYIMRVDLEEVYIVELTKTDGSTSRYAYRSDGGKWQGNSVTVGFSIE